MVTVKATLGMGGGRIEELVEDLTARLLMMTKTYTQSDSHLETPIT